jgi:RND superfamily putative drug exporter
MKKFVSKSWLITILWIFILVGAFITMPDLSNLVREKGQAKISDEYSYTIGKNILKKMDANGIQADKEFEIALLYRNPKGLTKTDKQQIEEKLSSLEKNKDKYHLLNVMNAIENKDYEGVLYSDDGTTLLVPVYVDRAHRSTEDVRNDLTAIMPVKGLDFYITGSDFVVEDFIKTTEGGVSRTEIITAIFIVLILMVIFKSPITPFVVLSTVGLSFFVSQNIVLQLVTYQNFPLSNFTKVFLILILFGIGTDYSLLLLMRYKEELAQTEDKCQAILTSYKTAGKTIIFSSLTIFIGFASLYFVKFETYRSAASVAVGIFILILALFTYVPGLMFLFGKFLFWSPFKSQPKTENKFWKRVSSFSVKFPGLGALIIAAFCGLIFFYSGNLSYDNLLEVDPKYSSIVGDRMAESQYGVGLISPVTIAIDNPEKMDTQEYLADIDKLTNIIKSIKGVKTVHSVTQPKGEVFKELYLNDQSQTLNTGLNDAQRGLGQIDSGLSSAIDQLSKADYGDDSIDDLKNGADSLISALSALKKGGNDLLGGIEKQATGTDQVANGIADVDNNLDKVSSSLATISSSYSQLSSGYTTINTQLGSINSSLSTIKAGLDGVAQMQAGMAAYPYDVNHDGVVDPGEVLGSDALFQQMAGTTSQLDTGLGQAIAGLGQLQSGLSSANGNLATVNAGLAQVQAGIASIKQGTASLKSGGDSLKSGINQIEVGQDDLLSGMSKIETGAKNLRDGQNQLIKGLNSIKGKMNDLLTGLENADDGVNQISSGIVDANDYLKGLEQSGISKNTFYIPEDQIYGDLFPRSMNIFFSKDKTITKLVVVLDVDPYSEEGMKVTRQIDEVFAEAIQTTKLKDASWGVGGVTQMNVDLQSMSDQAFVFARIIMLAAIFVVILIITRDFWMTLFVTISLVASYFISISLSGLFFKYIIGYNMLSWNVPFFSFIMIVTLGVDYSIFLIMRQKENEEGSATDSIINAAGKVGSVIVSAGLILSGTFAAMYPSGVRTLMEIAITVIIGIMLLVLVFIPVFIPSMISVKSKVFKG